MLFREIISLYSENYIKTSSLNKTSWAKFIYRTLMLSKGLTSLRIQCHTSWLLAVANAYGRRPAPSVEFRGIL